MNSLEGKANLKSVHIRANKWYLRHLLNKRLLQNQNLYKLRKLQETSENGQE